MKFRAEIDVMPIESLLDPQGRAVASGMRNLNLPEITNVRIGKHIILEFAAKSKEAANEIVDIACQKLLANPIMEFYEFKIMEEVPEEKGE